MDLGIDFNAMTPTHYRIADGCIWDIAAAHFVDAAPEGANVVELRAFGAPGDAVYLRKTLESYGKVVGLELMSLEEAKAEKMRQIDAETSASILAGFDYEIEGATYHFSYDEHDQQNFVDTVSMCQLSLAGTPGVPDSVVWNSYTVPGDELVQQAFDAASFVALYTAGAMAHKAAKMAAGGERKAKVAAAQSIAELGAI